MRWKPGVVWCGSSRPSPSFQSRVINSNPNLSHGASSSSNEQGAWTSDIKAVEIKIEAWGLLGINRRSELTIITITSKHAG